MAVGTIPSGASVVVSVTISANVTPISVTDSAGNTYGRTHSGAIGETAFLLETWEVDGAVGGTGVDLTILLPFAESMAAVVAVVQDVNATTPTDPSSPFVGSSTLLNPLTVTFTPTDANELFLFTGAAGEVSSTYSAVSGTLVAQVSSPDGKASVCVVQRTGGSIAPTTLSADSSPAPSTGWAAAVTALQAGKSAAPPFIGRAGIRPSNGLDSASRHVGGWAGG